ncbi:MAG TPA: SH3 domain-containing protein [Chloroflexi bacterium]|nr:SH3 domain-containing protein [Chloroflexota bacterium]
MRTRFVMILLVVWLTTVFFALGALAQDAITATPAPTPTSSPATSLTTTITATVNTGGVRLRVRATPSTAAPIVARLTDGSTVIVLARDASGDWVLTPLTDATVEAGWIATAYLRMHTPIGMLPIATVTPPPLTVTPVVSPSVAPFVMPTAIATPAPPAVALPSGLYGKLAVPVFDENRKTYDVWLVNADGSDLRRVVDEASSPALSADGAMLAYRRWKVDDRGIVVANVDGGNPWRITDKLEDVLPSFSPDRTKVAFSTYRWGDRKSRLYYAWSDEQNKVAWEWGAGGIFGEDPFWMNDGRILFRVTRPERGVEELWSMDGRTGEHQTLHYVTGSIRAPAVAPDNRTVAYMAFTGGNWDIYTYDLIDRTVTRLTDDRAEDGLPVFSPNGEYLAFVSNRGGQWGLWRMRPDGSDLQRIITLPGPVDGRVEFEPEYLNHGWLEEQIGWSW